MPPENVDNQQEIQELTPEQEAAADAEFEAAFNLTRGDEPHVEGTTPQDNATETATNTVKDNSQTDDDKVASEAAQAEAAAQAAAEAKAAEENAPVTLTAKQFNDLMATVGKVTDLEQQLTSTRDKTFGRMGQLQQTIADLQKSASSGNKLSIGQLKRMEAEYPELATILKEDLSEAFGATTENNQAPAGTTQQTQQTDDTQGTQQTQSNPLEDPDVQKVLQRKEMAIVTAKHETWATDKNTPEFSAWKKTLPDVAVNLLESTWDSEILVPAFDDFYKWRDAEKAKQTTKQQNDKRLANAITATDGRAVTGAHVLDEDAAFE